MISTKSLLNISFKTYYILLSYALGGNIVPVLLQSEYALLQKTEGSREVRNLLKRYGNSIWHLRTLTL